MAKGKAFSWQNALIRLFAAAVVVFATYNAEQISFYHWALKPPWEFSVVKAFSGVVLLIGWVVLLRATLRSLGPIGITLAIAFFALFVWLLIDLIKPEANARILTYLAQFVIIGVLTAGVSWSHIRRRISGQVDTDDVET